MFEETSSDVKVLSDMVQKMKKDEDILIRARDKLKQMEADFRRLTEIDIPTQCESCGVMALKLPTGESLDIKTTIRASISKAKQDAAFAWLRDNGFGDIIKNVVSASFNTGEDDKAHSAIVALEQQEGVLAEQKMSVHASTLKAWVTERDRECEQIPDELFGVFRGQKAVLK